MKKRSKQTNDEFIAELMKHSRNGALIQLYVISGLERYSEHVVAAHEQGNLKGGAFNFINPEAWADCAREVLEKVAKHYHGDNAENPAPSVN